MSKSNPEIGNKQSQVAGSDFKKQQIAISIVLLVIVIIIMWIFRGDKKDVVLEKKREVIATQHDDI